MSALRTVDFWSGTVFVSFGAGAIFIARSYPLGTAAHMGPAYFPIVLGLLLLVIGAALMIRGFQGGAVVIAPPTYRPLIVILLSVVAFGLTIDSLGIIVASALLIFGARMAAPGFQFKEMLEVTILAVVLIVSSIALFIYGLGLPFRIFPF